LENHVSTISTKTTWSVGSNEPGCICDSEPIEVETFAEAVDALIRELEWDLVVLSEDGDTEEFDNAVVVVSTWLDLNEKAPSYGDRFAVAVVVRENILGEADIREYFIARVENSVVAR
jgi:hypothetical protein